jgi:O-antigen/teichoic acid export membrane protein
MFGVLGISVFSSILLSRGLTPDDRGHFLGITMWNGFIMGLCDVGIYLATVYLWGKRMEEFRKQDVFATLLVWALATGGLCVVIIAVLAQWILQARLGDGEQWTAYAFFLSSFFGPLTAMLSGVLAAEGRFSLINSVRLGIPFVLTGLWAVYFMTDLLSVPMCLLTTAVVTTSTFLPFVWKARPYFKSIGSFRFAILRHAVWYGIRGYGGAVIDVIGGSGAQIMLFTLTPSALAFFQTASSATGVLWAIPKAIGITSFPSLIKEDRAYLHEKVCRFFRLTALSTGLGAVMLGLAEPLLIPFLFGKEYMPAVVPALLLLSNALFGGLSELLGGALSSTGRTLHSTIATAVYVTASLGCMALTLDTWGIVGAAFSTVIGFVLSFTVRLVWYSRTIQTIKPTEIIPRHEDFRELTGMVLGMYRKLNVRLRGKLSA